MARNEEKAQSMLYRFRKAMQSENNSEMWEGPPSPNEPLIPSTCRSLPAAMAARKAVFREISQKISRIQDSSLEESAIRTLNDDINNLIRKRHEWDGKARELGFEERDKKVKWGEEGLPEPGNVHGYLYFGRARELPGVKDLLLPVKVEKIKLPPKMQAMQEAADAEYFGVVENADELEVTEREIEKKLLNSTVPLRDWYTGLPVILPQMSSDLINDLIPEPLLIPTQEQVQQYLMDQRRQELLRKYT